MKMTDTEMIYVSVAISFLLVLGCIFNYSTIFGDKED